MKKVECGSREFLSLAVGIVANSTDAATNNIRDSADTGTIAEQLDCSVPHLNHNAKKSAT